MLTNKTGHVLSKMLILDPEAYEKIKETENLSYLDTKMNKILELKKITDLKKWYLYRQQLLKYIFLNRKLKNSSRLDDMNNKTKNVNKFSRDVKNTETQTSDTVEYGHSDSEDGYIQDFDTDENLSLSGSKHEIPKASSFNAQNLPSYIGNKSVVSWESQPAESVSKEHSGFDIIDDDDVNDAIMTEMNASNNDDEEMSFKSTTTSTPTSTPSHNIRNKPYELWKSQFNKSSMKQWDKLAKDRENLNEVQFNIPLTKSHKEPLMKEIIPQKRPRGDISITLNKSKTEHPSPKKGKVLTAQASAPAIVNRGYFLPTESFISKLSSHPSQLHRKQLSVQTQQPSDVQHKIIKPPSKNNTIRPTTRSQTKFQQKGGSMFKWEKLYK